MAEPGRIDAGAFASGLQLSGLIDPAAAAAAGFPHMPLDPSTAQLLLSGLAQQPGGGQPGQPGAGLFLNSAALAAALGQAAGAGGLDGSGDGGDGELGPDGEPKAPADPNDPEAVAAALAARIAAVGAAVIFEKSLTASDVSGGGRVVVPKSVAEQYFPKLEQPSGVTISASDLDGRTYTFKWRFWVNNSSRMYLLEGAGELHRNYGLEVGDVMVFAQKPDGSLVVAGRVANKSDLIKKAPIKRPPPNAAAAVPAGQALPRGAREARGRAPPRQAAASPGVEGAQAGGAGAGGGGSPTGRSLGAGGAVAAGGGAAGGDGGARGRKRKSAGASAGAGGGGGEGRFRGGARGEEGGSLSVLDMEAPSDGIFRAVVLHQSGSVPVGVALARNNRWTATLDVAGELYQAFFDTRDDAVEALTAAGASP
ncbi:hypothetical protein HYH03_018735 [Edaphochlamys debaryana]|uniref:TF-B3 domain-containing protein n=1 Tax=Edaphochlamys debaryana TaxID=47281 RepID=A0A835XEQ3_9CHLO|nr:hypothetical protein HYH03_018735 [Edaphochlamys debaryana]|eukprot:KAG2482326.1 hypothetical protein HYH03_018735 [Edaphochlamys debaryana]